MERFCSRAANQGGTMRKFFQILAGPAKFLWRMVTSPFRFMFWAMKWILIMFLSWFIGMFTIFAASPNLFGYLPDGFAMPLVPITMTMAPASHDFFSWEIDDGGTLHLVFRPGDLGPQQVREWVLEKADTS